MNVIQYFIIFIFSVVLLGCEEKLEIESRYIKVKILGDIYSGDWLEVNNYRMEVVLPDTMSAVAFNPQYDPYVMALDDDDTKVGYISPSLTYQVGAKKVINKKLTKGQLLYNIARMLTKLSYAEYDSSVFEYKTDKITALNGLLIFGMVDGSNVHIAYPPNMNISIEPYTPKN